MPADDLDPGPASARLAASAAAVPAAAGLVVASLALALLPGAPSGEGPGPPPEVSLLAGLHDGLHDGLGPGEPGELPGPRRSLQPCTLERSLGGAGATGCHALEVAGGRVVALLDVPAPSGSRESGAGAAGRLVVLDPSSGAVLVDLEHPCPLLRLDLHPSGRVAALGTAAGEVLGVDLEEGRELFRTRVGGEGVPVHAVDFAEDARTLVALTSEQLLRLAFPSGRLLRSLPVPSDDLAHVEHAPGDDLLLVAPRSPHGEAGGHRSAWLLQRDPAQWTELPGEHAVRWAEWAPDHDRVVIADASGRARVLGLDGALQAEASAPAPLHAARFSPDGARLALGTAAGEVIVHDLVRGVPVARARQPHAVVGLAWSPDGSQVALCGVGEGAGLGGGSLDLTWDAAGERVLTWGAGQVPRAWRARVDSGGD